MVQVTTISFVTKQVSAKRGWWVMVLLFALLFFVAETKGQDMKLWYNEPAKTWVEALPLGNSRLGAMVYGIPQREELQLNEETIWGGGPHRNDNPKALAALPEVQKMIFEGKTREADKLVNETFLPKHTGCPIKPRVV
ncbi:glycoside hydrolase family 95 protein [Niabella hibiscisoli]|uniref:glycoside hydrolase family 95 protein n=1 Tax=Niabella hibiscisoli TaxID=1825928 RepID=UPI0021D3F8E5|nr:glycoside hydrolase family 95 protein [Niabella hibiscisoli]